MPITALPPEPSRSDPPAVFVAKSNAFVAALQQLVTEMNAVVGVANITKWVSGTTYAIGDVTWSPLDFQAYRRKTAGAGTTDPSLDTTNWQRTEVSGTSLQAQSFTAFTSAGAAPAFTATPSPAFTAYAAGQRLRVKFHAAGTTGSNTLNVSGLGVKSIKQYDATGTKVAGVVASGQLADVEYDGTDFVIVNPLLRLASTAEAQAGVDGLKLLTPATLVAALQGSNQSLGASGYQKLPGGLIIQWGTIPSTSDDTDSLVTFPIAFPTACRGVYPANNTANAGAASFNVTGLTAVNVNFRNSSSVAVAQGGYYLAIGH